jgi:hypothetical protein
LALCIEAVALYPRTVAVAAAALQAIVIQAGTYVPAMNATVGNITAADATAADATAGNVTAANATAANATAAGATAVNATAANTTAAAGDMAGLDGFAAVSLLRIVPVHCVSPLTMCVHSRVPANSDSVGSDSCSSTAFLRF